MVTFVYIRIWILLLLFSHPLVAYNEVDYNYFYSYISEQFAERPSFEGRDLSGIIINGTALKGRDALKGVNFKGSNLEKVIFINLNLDDTKFDQANLAGAHFINTSCKRASFRYANLSAVRAFSLTKKNWDPEKNCVLHSDNAKKVGYYKNIAQKLKDRPLSTIASLAFGPISSLTKSSTWLAIPAAFICLPYYSLLFLEEGVVSIRMRVKNFFVNKTDFSFADFSYARLDEASFCGLGKSFLDSKVEDVLITKNSNAGYEIIFNEFEAKIDNAIFHYTYIYNAQLPGKLIGKTVSNCSFRFIRGKDRMILRTFVVGYRSRANAVSADKLTPTRSLFIKDIECLRAKLCFGADPNQMLVAFPGVALTKFPALLCAIKCGQENTVSELLKGPDASLPEWCRRKSAANPLLTDNADNNALHWAVEITMSSAINQLAQHSRAQQLINKKNTDGLTPLTLAIVNGNKSVIKKLIEFGPSKDQPVYSKVLKHHKSDFVSFFNKLGYGFNVNVKDIDSLTALHYAVKSNDNALSTSTNSSQNNVSSVKKLMTLGARRDIRNKHGQSPLYFARLKGDRQLEEILNAPQASDQELLNIGTEDVLMILNKLTSESPRSLHSFVYASEAEVLAVKESLKKKVTAYNISEHKHVQFYEYATMEIDQEREEEDDIYALLGGTNLSQNSGDLTPNDLFKARFKTASNNAPSVLFMHKLHEVAKGDGMLGTLKRELESKDYPGVMVVSTMQEFQNMESALRNRLAVDMRPASFILTHNQRSQLLKYFFGLHVPQLLLNEDEFGQLVCATAGMSRDELKLFVTNSETRAQTKNGLAGCVRRSNFVITAH